METLKITEKQAKEIRQLLEDRKEASSDELKSIAGRLRNRGFYLSYFGNNFSAEDFDKAVENKHIIIENSLIPTTQKIQKQLSSDVSQTVVVCPYCKNTVFAPSQIGASFKCSSCGADLITLNPSKTNSNNAKKGCLIAILIIFIFACLGQCIGSGDKNKVVNSAWDSSVWQVKNYLKNNYLKDPSSYEAIEWSAVQEIQGSPNYKYCIRHKYRAKNSFGGYVIENKIFYLDDNGTVVDFQDASY